jgi:hypothetical protein
VATQSTSNKRSSRPATKTAGGRSAGSKSDGKTATRRTSAASRPAAARKASAASRPGTARETSAPSRQGTARETSARARPTSTRMTKAAIGALAGSAAVGAASVAGRVLAKRSRRTRILGVAIPRDLAPTKVVDPRKLVAGIDLKQVVRQIGDAAEQIEARSEDVRLLSAQAKRLSRKLS